MIAYPAKNMNLKMNLDFTSQTLREAKSEFILAFQCIYEAKSEFILAFQCIYEAKSEFIFIVIRC